MEIGSKVLTSILLGRLVCVASAVDRDWIGLIMVVGTARILRGAGGKAVGWLQFSLSSLLKRVVRA